MQSFINENPKHSLQFAIFAHIIYLIMKYFVALLLIVCFAACNGDDKTPEDDKTLIPKETPAIAYNITNVFPHDTTSYTEGLELHNGKLYESAGYYSQSALQIEDIKTGKVLQKYKIGKNATDSTFGEGITIFKGKIYQLTWQSHIVFVYDVNNINKVIKTFNWPYDGWGMTHNDTSLILSDGSANIYFVDAENFKLKSRITVSADAGPIDNINELELIDGFIFANVWQKNIIIKINPTNGKVVGQIDFTGVIEKNAPGFVAKPGDDVLNGIAYDSTTKKLYITGKRWPKLFEVSLN